MSCSFLSAYRTFPRSVVFDFSQLRLFFDDEDGLCSILELDTDEVNVGLLRANTVFSQ